METHAHVPIGSVSEVGLIFTQLLAGIPTKRVIMRIMLLCAKAHDTSLRGITWPVLVFQKALDNTRSDTSFLKHIQHTHGGE